MNDEQKFNIKRHEVVLALMRAEKERGDSVISGATLDGLISDVEVRLRDLQNGKNDE